MKQNDANLGLWLMVISVLLSPLIDIFSKLAVTSIPAAQITAARFLLQIAFLLPIVLCRRTLFDITWKKTGLHALRGALMAITMLSFITTLKVMQVADAIAIFFVEPIILTIMGSIFLKETIGWRRYTACAVGFFGAMLVIQPSMQEVGPIALLPVVSAFSLATFLLLTRMVARNEDPWSMQLYASIWGGIIMILLLLVGHVAAIPSADPVMPEMTDSLYLLGVGVTATVAGVLSVYAYRAAPASTLAPLQYLEIVSATIFGWLVFDHLPDAVKWLGIAIIIASGLYIIWRERRTNKQASIPPVSPVI
ncbi:DMT family transporter [Rhizobium sp. CFBP 8762]|uniref:DMT family transporter n=1 Tax=Rhizobium sp. CFBP 8762 TaxID=2775279 RepID=UPI00313A908E